MSKIVLKDCSIVINGVDLSDHSSSVEIALKKAAIDTTNFSGGGKEAIAGLSEDTFTVDFQQDFGVAEVNATLIPLYENETEFVVVVKAHSASVTATNPSFTGTCILLEYSPLAGKVGSLSETKVKMMSQRSGIAMATS
jgi:hypothetical protein